MNEILQKPESTEQPEDLLGLVANEFFERLALGEHPTIEDYATRYPRIAEEIRLTFPALALVGKSLSSPLTTHSIDVQPDQRLGDFRIVAELGRGGMGIVYEAEQVSMGRRVALKVLPFATLAGEKPLQRFKNEVRAAATLDHPNIVSVYSVGEERRIHYYAMQLIRGTTLGSVIAQLRELRGTGEPPAADSISVAVSSSDAGSGKHGALHDARGTQSTLPLAHRTTESSHSPREFFRSVAQLGVQAASALHYAHEQGVVHRDIKPANLLVDSEGEVYITDFGLARIEADAGVTMTGDLVGTLRYMSPEQALGKHTRVDHRTDVYSLGVTLYELVTLRAAFLSQDRHSLLREISTKEPPLPRRLDPAVPIDLETIILKAMSKETNDRYESAEALGKDLRNYLEHKPLTARRPGAIDRIRKWGTRHPSTVQSAVFSLLLVVVILMISVVSIRSMNSRLLVAYGVAADQARQAERAREQSDALLYAADVRLAANGLKNHNLGPARERLARHIPQSGEPDRRGFVWHYLWNELHPEDKTMETDDAVRDVRYSPDGTLIAAAHDSGRITIWDEDIREPLQVLRGHHETIRDISFSPDGGILASACDDGTVTLWAVLNGKARASFAAHPEGVQALRFGPHGTLITAGGRFVKKWRDTWEHPVATLGPLRGPVHDIAISPDASQIAVASTHTAGVHGVSIWDFENFALPRHLLKEPRKCVALQYDPTGRQLIAGRQYGGLVVWELEDSVSRKKTCLEHTSNIYHITFSADGKLAATASKDMTIRIWDAQTWEMIRVLQGHSGRVYGAHFAPRGGRLVTSSSDGTIKLWRPAVRHFTRTVIDQFVLEPLTFGAGHLGSVSTSGRQISTYRLPASRVTRLPLLNVSSGAASQDLIVAASRRALLYHGPKSIERLPSSSTSMADVDADGDMDKVAGFGPSRQLVWQENLGHGRFQPACLVRPQDAVVRFESVVCNMEGDTQQDLVTVVGESFLLSRTEPGRIDPPVPMLRISAPFGYAMADLNNDARMDVAFASEDRLNGYIQAADGTFQEITPKSGIGLLGARAVAVCDTSGDGRADIIGSSDVARELVVLQNTGSGFEIAQRLHTTITPTLLDIQDVNLDANPDVIVAGAEGVVYFENDNGTLCNEGVPLRSLDNANWSRSLVANVAIWDTVSSELAGAFYGHCDHIKGVAISPDSRQIATVGRDHIIRFWDKTGRELAAVATGNTEVRSLIYSGDGRCLCAAVGDDLHIYNTESFSLLHQCTGHQNTITSLCVSDDSKTVATGSSDLSIRLWSLDSGKLRHTLTGHTSNPLSICFSPDGRLLASGDVMGTVRIWDMRSHQELLDLTDFDVNVIAIAFSDTDTLCVYGNTAESTLDEGRWSIRGTNELSDREPRMSDDVE